MQVARGIDIISMLHEALIKRQKEIQPENEEQIELPNLFLCKDKRIQDNL